MAFIYKVTNKLNGKMYIGKSKYNVSTYYGSGLRITYAIKKYGKENFEKSILEECLDIESSCKEIQWITKFNSTDPAIGYNISKGGDGGAHYWNTLAEEERRLHNKKISEGKKGKTHKPHSIETKRKMSNSFNRDPQFLLERALAKCKWYTCANHQTGMVYKTKNLREFCKTHQINFKAMQHNARTRKNMCNKTWSCSFNLYEEYSDEEILNFLKEEFNRNNMAYREKISQSRLKKVNSGNV
jgi:group I intron endonuclease